MAMSATEVDEGSPEQWALLDKDAGHEGKGTIALGVKGGHVQADSCIPRWGRALAAHRAAPGACRGVFAPRIDSHRD